MNISVGVSSCNIYKGSTKEATISTIFLRSSKSTLCIALSKIKFTLTISKKIPKRLRKALRKDPATTLPKFLQNNLITGLNV